MSNSGVSTLKEFYEFVMLEENGIIDNTMFEMFNKLPGRNELPDYYLTIQKPMSFQKILRGLKQYNGDIQAMIQDFCQIAYNCRFYNEEGSIYYVTAVKLDKMIKEKMVPKAKEMFKNTTIHWVDLGSEPAKNDTAKESSENKNESSTGEPTKSNSDFKETKSLSSFESENQHSNATNLAPQQFEDNSYIPEEGFDDGKGIFTSKSGKQYITSPDVARNFTRVPVGSRLRFPKYVEDRIHVYHGQTFLGLSEHQSRKKGRPTIKPLLETKYLQFLNDERILENPLLDHKATFLFDGTVKTFEQIKFNIKRGFIVTVEELMLALKEVCEYQVNQALQQNQDAVKNFTSKALDRAFIFFSDFNQLKDDSDKITVDRIEYNGTVYEIGSFVLLKNTVDETRPIPAQIFQIWREASDNSLWMSCSWYLRPEQTVHRVDRVFYKNEVVKSTQSRIHRIEDILGMCSVIHFTRFVRAEPLDAVQPMFICEYRYNDSSYKFNKIRTWKGAVPDAVKDLEEYDVPLSQPRFLKKFESPLKHLLDPNLSLNSSSPPDSLPTLQSTKESEQPSLGNVYRDCVVERDELGEYSTSLKYTQRHLILPQHFHLLPPNVRFDPKSESFIDSTNLLNPMVMAIYGTGVQNFNAPSIDHLSRTGLSRSLPQAHNPSTRLATLKNYGGNQAGVMETTATNDLSATTSGMAHLQSRSAMTKALLNAAAKKKAKYNKSLNAKSSSQTSQTGSKTLNQSVKTDNVSTKSHYLDVLLLKNRLSKNIPAFLGDGKTIDPDNKYHITEKQSFILNEPVMDHIEGFRRSNAEINQRITTDVQRYNSTLTDKKDHVILYNNSNLKNEAEKKLQDFKLKELQKKQEEDALAVAKDEEVLDSDAEIENLYLSKNQRKRKNSELSSDGSFIDSELSESEIIERRAFKKLQKLDKKEEEEEEDSLMKKYCRMVEGVKKGDIIWFRGMGSDIVKRIIDPKNPLDSAGVGPSLEYLQYKLKKGNLTEKSK